MADEPTVPVWTDEPEVGPTTVATAVAEVHPLVVGDGAMLVDTRTRAVHRVNRTAAAVFALCDGELDVAAVAGELAELFGVDAEAIVGDVASTVAQYRALGVVVLDGDPAPAPTDSDVPAGPHVPAPCSPCQDNIDALGWGPTVAVAAGEKVLGVRADREATAERIRARFADRVVDDPEVPANWSVVLLADESVPVGNHTRSGLYEGHVWISGDLDHDGIVDLVDRRLRQHETPGPGRVALAASALVGDRGAVLVPWQGRHPDPATAEVAAGHGWPVLAAPVVVDVADPTAPAVIDDRQGAHRIPLVGTVGWGAETAKLDADDAVVAVIGLAHGLRDAEDPDDLLQRLADAAGSVTVVATTPDKQADVAAALVRARK